MSLMHVAIYPDFNNSVKAITPFVMRLLERQVESQLPVMTLYMHARTVQPSQWFTGQLITLLNKLSHSRIIMDNQIKISVLGQWYEMDDDVVEAIKTAIVSTKDFDGQFLNLCINYDGRHDISQAVTMIARRILTGKLHIDGITPDAIKEHIDSSFFVPPDSIILLDGRESLSGFLLWDSAYAKIKRMDVAWHAWDGVW